MNATPLKLVVVAALATLASAGPTLADDEAALISASCTGCHTTVEGIETSIPNLSTYKPSDIVDLLTAFRDDEDATLMNRIARGYSDAEIEMIAGYIGKAEE